MTLVLYTGALTAMVAILAAMLSGGDAGATIGITALVMGGFLVYFLPAMIAEQRGHLSSGAIFALNLLLGWTFLGWVAALVWALSGDTEANRAAEAALYREPVAH